MIRNVVLFEKGQAVDAFIQPAPGPWDIPAKCPNFFLDGKQVVRVPYTSSVKVNSILCADRRQTSKQTFPFKIFADKDVVCSPATHAWEWGENLVKTAPVLGT